MNNEKMITKEQMKKIQIDILDDVAKFCEENNIKYWIDAGTLLGAIRHKGYIPWDDDIDLGMLREEYDKFIKLYNLKNSKYKLKCIELDKTYEYPYGKVIDTDTILYEPDEKGIKIAVNIDVFVYDNAPDDVHELNRMYNKRDKYERLRLYQKFVPSSDCSIKRIIKKIIKCILNFFPKDYFIMKIVKNSKKYCKTQCSNIGNFTSTSRISCSKSIFDEYIEVEFEGKKYKAPKGYNEWLTIIYGNYMELPPVEKRISPHSFIAYYKK